MHAYLYLNLRMLQIVKNHVLNFNILLHQALVHVSTAYCNCDRRDVAEMIYNPPFNPDDIISLVQWLPEDLLDKVR